MPVVKITPSTGQVISLSVAKRHLRVDLVDADNDADITDAIADAQAAAEDRLGRSLLPTTWLATFRSFRCEPLLLQKPPIISIGSVKYLDPAGVLQTLDPTSYGVDLAGAPGLLFPVPGSAWRGTPWPLTAFQPNAVQVTYTAGYADASKVPTPIVRWIKLALADLYTQRARSTERPVLPNDFADSLLDEYKVWSA